MGVNMIVLMYGESEVEGKREKKEKTEDWKTGTLCISQAAISLCACGYLAGWCGVPASANMRWGSTLEESVSEPYVSRGTAGLQLAT